MINRRADEIEAGSEAEATVLGYFVTLMKGDLAAFAELWADEAVQEHPFRFEGLTPALRGKQAVVDDYHRMFRGRSDMVFTIKDIYQAKGRDIFIVEFHGRSIITETGGIYDQNYIDLFDVTGGKILLHRMYFDPLVTERAFKGVLIGEGISPQSAD